MSGGHDRALALRLILDELFDLSLYQALRDASTKRLWGIAL